MMLVLLSLSILLNKKCRFYRSKLYSFRVRCGRLEEVIIEIIITTINYDVGFL